MEVKLLDSIFHCENLFVDRVIMVLGRFELSASVTTISSFTIFFFDEDDTPVGVTGISLENDLTGGRNSESRWRLCNFLQLDYGISV